MAEREATIWGPEGPGNSDRITRDFFDSLLLKIRLIDAKFPDTGFDFLGRHFVSPIMTAALSHLPNDGTVKLAQACAAADAVNWIGLSDDAEIERVCATGAATVRVIKPSKDESVIYHHLAMAEKAGCLAVGMDIDHGFTNKGTENVLFGDVLEPKSALQLKKYVEATRLPFFIKGSLHPDDAVKCVELGAAGIVLSHHHGMLNYAVPPCQVLPEVRAAVGDKLKIIVDCGVNSGLDAFKALALGADAVCVGRALMPVLNEGGAEGAAELLRTFTAELASAMAFTACPTLSAIEPSLITRR